MNEHQFADPIVLREGQFVGNLIVNEKERMRLDIQRTVAIVSEIGENQQPKILCYVYERDENTANTT